MAQDVICPGEDSMCMRKRWNSLFWGEMSYRYQLGLTGPLWVFALCIEVLLCWVHIYLFYLLGLIILSFCSTLLCLFSWPLFQSLFYLIRVSLLLLSFGLHLHEISFSSPLLSVCMCPLVWGGSLVDSTYRGLFLYPFSSLCLLVGAFNPFTFKVIIDKYDPIAIYFVVLGLSL